MEEMITTERLILRPWREEDRESYAAMMADPEVAYWMGGLQSRETNLAAINRFEAHYRDHGFGWFAIERRGDGAFVGAAGLFVLLTDDPLAPGVEAGWRLARDAWGSGYASEAARAVLADGFERLRLPEIIAFTAEPNVRSQAVMKRIGMVRDPSRDFDHPALAQDHPLRRHVVYVATAR